MRLLREKFSLAFIGFCVFLFIIIFKKTTLFLDPDFGWHIRTGQFVLEHIFQGRFLDGFPQNDPFSYTMPSFPFIAHSWLTDSLFAALLPHISYDGLAAILSVVAILSLIVPLWPIRPHTKPWALIPLSLGASALLSYLSVRPQTFSWLFFSLFTVIVFEKRYWNRFKWWLPILMLIWTNMHGSFAAGGGLLGFVIFFRLIRRQEVPRTDFIVLALTFLVTLINPYGIHLWREVLLTFTDDKLRTQVSEWNPLILRLTFFHVPILALSLVFAIKFYASLSKSLVFAFLGLLLVGITSSKLFPLWTIVAVYLIGTSIQILEKQLAKNKFASERLSLFLKYVAVFSIATLLLHIPRTWKIYSIYKEGTFYPAEAVQFIQKNNPSDNIFTAFGWGGYMLWKLPDRKVFVDGRMTYWDHVPSNSSESQDAFTEYTELIYGKADIDKVFEKYHVRTILLPKHDAFEQLNTFTTRLEDLEWPVLYEDDVSIIYARPE